MVYSVSDSPLSTRLARFVRRIRVIDATVAGGVGPGQTYWRLPDGETEILIRFGGGDVSASVIGTRTFVLTKRATHPAGTLLLRFRAGGAYPFFGRRMSELTDRVLPLDEIWQARVYDALNDIADGRTAADRTRAVLELMLNESRVAEPPSILATRRAIELIRQAARLPTASALAAGLGVSERQLRRAFAEAVGMSPKQFLRVARFRRVLALAGRQEPCWAAIAKDAGYFDQAHLIADFRAMTGHAPAAWLSARRAEGLTGVSSRDISKHNERH